MRLRKRRFSFGLDYGIDTSGGGTSLPTPDALFDTRTGLVLSDSIGGLTANFKDFIYFNLKSSSTGQVVSADNTYIAPDTGDLTCITFIKPNQASVNLTDIKGFGGNTGNYIRITSLAKTAAAYLGTGILTSASAFPDSANFLTNVYMLVWKYVQADGKAYFRIYNTSTNYSTEKSRTAALPASNSTPLQFKQAAVNADCGIILQLYYTANIDDTTLSGIWNGTIPTANLTSLTNFVHGEGILAHTWDTKNGGQFQFKSSTSLPPASPYYNLRTSNIHAASPLIYGYTKRAMQDISYLPNGTKGILDKVGDIECASNILWNMANGRLYFDAVTDATVKAIFDKSNRTYWKASIESQEHYIDAGSGYYGVWGASQLQRDFILTHAATGHENHIFSSLRTSGAVITGITAIRVYKTNVS